ncbi:MAG: CPBP family intramembrane metalloprotease [Candidatus Omnitrophica bacterium]|nr:CPBP family intramembrane metalloprotease [Candidatus Omnitrophota bacterium]
MKFLSKRNIYVILACVFLFGIIFLNIISLQDTKEPEVRFNFGKKLPLQQIFLLNFFGFLYLLLFVWGTINVLNLLGKRLKRQHFFDNVKIKKFQLSEEKSSKLFFFIFLTIFLAQIFQIVFFDPKTNPIAKIIFTNFILECILILIILKFIPRSQLNFDFKNLNFDIVFKLYTMLFPLIFIAFTLSNLVFKNFKIESSINPAITILLSLNNKMLANLFFVQIIFLGPLAEELFFRGFIYKLTRTQFSFFFSALFTSFVFALLHRTFYDILPLTIISMLLCYIYEKTQNLANAFILHFLHNSLNLIGILLLKSYIFIS